MKHKNYKIADYVPSIFKKEQYAACYSSMIYPVNGQDLWMRTECTDLQPPPMKRQLGRPKKKRRLDASELMRDNSQMKRATYGIKCSRCKRTGHNKSTFPLPPPPPPLTTQPAPSSQAAPQPSKTQASQSPIQKKKRSPRERKNVD